jgi:hypothetical protein
VHLSPAKTNRRCSSAAAAPLPRRRPTPASFKVQGWVASPATATRYRSRAQGSRGKPSPTPVDRQSKGICLLAPDAVKVACPVRGRGQGLIRRESSNPLFSAHDLVDTSTGGVRTGNGVREAMPERPGYGERRCKPFPGRRRKAAQPVPQTTAVQVGARPTSASRMKPFGDVGGAKGERGRALEPKASTDSLSV